MSLTAVSVERRFEGATIHCRAPSIRLRIASAGYQSLSVEACNAAREAVGASGQISRGVTTPALLIGELAVQLQRSAGFACERFAQSNIQGDAAFIDYEAPDSKTGLAAGIAAGVMVSMLLDGRFDPEHPHELNGTAKTFLTDYTRSGKRAPFDYVWTALARNLPWRRVAADADIYEIGHGCKRRLYFRHSTMGTPQVSCVAATRKSVSARMLRDAGLPVPPHHVATSEAEAVAAAGSLGFPVAIKPESTDFGTAVTTNVCSEQEVKTAFQLARKHGRVLIEKHINGFSYRLLVIHGKMVSAVRQTPAHVIGDGRSTIAALVEEENAGRSEGLSERWKKITLDAAADAVLEQQGFNRQGVPPANATVWLRLQSNLSTGGTMANVTAEVHPDYARMAERAASILGLDVAGIDFITADISRPSGDGGICEINPNPGFIMGEPPDRLENLFLEPGFPAHATGRIPIIIVVGTDPLLAMEITAEAARHWPGLGVSNGFRINVAGHDAAAVELGAADGTRALLSDPAIEALLQITTPEEIIVNGLGCDRIDLAILASPSLDAAVADLVTSLAQTVVSVEDGLSFTGTCRAAVSKVADGAY